MNDDDFQVYRGSRGDLLVRRGHIWLAFTETQAVDKLGNSESRNFRNLPPDCKVTPKAGPTCVSKFMTAADVANRLIDLVEGA